MTVVVSALGALLGYVGAEVAEESIFERILWLQHFYNYLDLESVVRMAVFGPLGGPVHRAALQTLDKLRQHGLYRGRNWGDFLGTTVFPDLEGIKYRRVTAIGNEDQKMPKPARNCLWIRVI